MAKIKIQLPKEMKQLDNVVEECIKAESITDDSLAAECVQKAETKASWFSKILAAADFVYDSYLLFQAFNYFKSGDIFSALNVIFATLLPRVISNIKEKFVKKDSDHSQRIDKSSGSDPP